MHTLTKVLVILNLVICLIVSQYVWVSLAGNVRWRESYEWEVAQRHMDKNELERAYNTLLAARDENRQRATGWRRGAGRLCCFQCDRLPAEKAGAQGHHQSRTQRPLPLWQWPEVQEVLHA